MITVLMLNIIVVFFAYLARYNRLDYGLKISFFLIFVFLALRFNYGNDYSTYFNTFNSINNETSMDYFDSSLRMEPGWIFLCHLFKPFGFFSMIAVISLFNCFIYYRFIKKYVPSNYYWLAVFLYVFGPGYMLTHSSAMRQSLAINLFILSFDFLYNKKIIQYFICVGIASLFHSSALILFPVYLITLYDIKVSNKLAIIIFSLFLCIFIFGKKLVPDINLIIELYFDKYAAYQESAEIGTGLGLIFYSILFALILFYDKYQEGEGCFLFKLAIISYSIMPLGLLISMILRLGMYFEPALLCVLPLILTSIKKPYVRDIVLIMLITVTLYSFYSFFHSETYGEYFSTYNTIFSYNGNTGI